MDVLYKKSLLAFRKFGIIDIGVFKIYLFSLGLLLGLCKEKATRGLKVFTGFLAIISGVYIIYKFFYKYWE